MIALSLTDVAAAVGGALHDADGTELVTGGVEFDSRRVGPGGLFVALPGERVDGHDYAAAAMAAGAAGVLAGRPVEVPAVVAGPADPGTALGSYALAADADGAGAAVLAALARLARALVDRLRPGGLRIVGITGSSGKTSTKDMVAALLDPLGPTVAPPGSFNNEIGHPWTVLRADGATRHLVLELSARGPGHVAALCRVAPPSVGVVLNVGSAHLGEFGSREAVALAKGELVETLPTDGVAVLNADDPAVAAMAGRTAARVVRFGRSAAADVRAADVGLDSAGRASFRLVSSAGEATVTLAVHGAHQVGNALAAAAVALELGATPQHVARVLGGYQPASRWRMEVTDRPDGLTVVNDAYNANPESVRAALHTLVAMAEGGRRSWAVLGPLGELGPATDREHAEIGRLVVRLGVGRLVVVGEAARSMYRAAGAAPGAATQGKATQHKAEPVLAADVESALALLRAELAPGDVVLVKASRTFGLERIADGLLDPTVPDATVPDATVPDATVPDATVPDA
ncbi:MAG: UDP-N-acetylmuramoyl-tripeptide--D-alanyl-D-alanine ligase, partial [Pseudonocardiaceae bacterium]|nr:UDP-N-acetylmuramoyl-tripeptide--D-alanyl-D-alanine ligase [Pseudonocardiaceae bacterium]